MQILQREVEHDEQVKQAKLQKEIIAKAAVDQRRNLLIEKEAQEEAIRAVQTLSSKGAKEKVLKEKLDDRLVRKVQ